MGAARALTAATVAARESEVGVAVGVDNVESGEPAVALLERDPRRLAAYLTCVREQDPHTSFLLHTGGTGKQ